MQRLDQLYKEWCTLQPLKPEYRKRLDDKFKLEFNFNSNHIEGNTLTYGQTKLLFLFGETSGNASLRDYEEMQAHNVGLEMIKQVALDKKRPLTEIFIRELNRTILVQNYWKIAQTAGGESTRIEIKVGTYKSRPNSVRTITGEEFHYASPEETPAFMTALVNWYNHEETSGRLSPVELAALLHYRYIRIHPFEDGNGRIARLLVNYVLHRHGYPMLVVHTEDKDNYLRVLHQCDIQCGLTPSDGANATIGQIRPFVEYMEVQLQRALETGIRAAKGEDIEDDDDFSKRITLIRRKLAAKNENAGVYTVNQFWKIMEEFYYPLSKRIIDSLKPASDLFHRTSSYHNLIASNNSQKGLHLDKAMKFADNKDISHDIKEVQSLTFRYCLADPKDTNLPAGEINVTITLHFAENVYTMEWLPDKEFPYGTFPSEEDTKRLITIFKNKIMQKIEELTE